MKRALQFLILLWPLVYGVAHSAPACWPDVQVKTQKVVVVNLPNGFREKRLALWTCATPTGYTNIAFAYTDADLAKWVPVVLNGSFTKAIGDAAYKATADDLVEDNLRAAIAKLQAPYKAAAKVSTNGTATTRPVYALAPDGTRGEEMEGVRVAVGARCYLNGRLAGTSYYRIDGADNALTPAADRIGTAVAQCSVTLPIGANGG